VQAVVLTLQRSQDYVMNVWEQ